MRFNPKLEENLWPALAVAALGSGPWRPPGSLADGLLTAHALQQQGAAGGSFFAGCAGGGARVDTAFDQVLASAAEARAFYTVPCLPGSALSLQPDNLLVSGMRMRAGCRSWGDMAMALQCLAPEAVNVSAAWRWDAAAQHRPALRNSVQRPTGPWRDVLRGMAA